MSKERCSLIPNNGEGCGGIFPHKSVEGLCAKCAELAKHPRNSALWDMWTAYNQCKGCGIAYANLRERLCGECDAREHERERNSTAQSDSSGLPGSSDDSIQHRTTNIIDASRTARAQALSARFGSLHTMAPPSTFTTQSLLTAKSNVQGDANKIYIKFQCRIRGTGTAKSLPPIDADLGEWGCSWSKEAYLSEAHDHALKTLNERWTHYHGMELLLTETELRWANNLVFHSGTGSQTIGNTYAQYMNGAMAAHYSSQKQTKGLKSGPTMSLELYIDKPAFLKRKDETTRLAGQAPVASMVLGRKRSATSTTLDGEERYMGGGGGGFLGSSFIRTTSSSTPTASRSITTTTIQFMRADTVCDAETGQVDILWPSSDTGRMHTGRIGISLFASGETKVCFNLSSDSDLFVAKRFNAEAAPTWEKNRNALEHELIRLKSISWFWKQFKKSTRENQTKICNDIVVSDGFLIQEHNGLSEPSGLSSSDSSAGAQAFWLVEPRRTTAVVKYSGTLSYPRRTDLKGMTLFAFAHFVYEASHKELVIADIQGSQMPVNGRDTLVLFDLMTHSTSGDSGIGDYGSRGINAFLSQHSCNRICQSLQLSRCILTSDDNEEKEDDGDGNDSEQAGEESLSE